MSTINDFITNNSVYKFKDDIVLYCAKYKHNGKIIGFRTSKGYNYTYSSIKALRENLKYIFKNISELYKDNDLDNLVDMYFEIIELK